MRYSYTVFLIIHYSCYILLIMYNQEFYWQFYMLIIVYWYQLLCIIYVLYPYLLYIISNFILLCILYYYL